MVSHTSEFDLNEFEASDTWREQLKKFLMEGNRTATEIRESFKQTERNFLDLDSDFQTILEKKNIPRSKKEGETKKMEYFLKNNERTSFDAPIVDDKNSVLSQSQCFSDDSFEVMEKMCEKTASDPDSTLFQYLKSDQKDIVVADAKKRIASNSYIRKSGNDEEYDAESAALQRLLDDMKLNNNGTLDRKQNASTDTTQLEDIEAPSRFWENSIIGDSIVQTSPVKMVGLMRPSTIIEELADESDCSGKSTQTSFNTALKENDVSKASTSYYDTAHDSHDNLNSIKSNILVNDQGDYQKYSKLVINKTRDDDDTINLIQLDNTLDNIVEQHFGNQSDFNSDESIIEIISDDEDIPNMEHSTFDVNEINNSTEVKSIVETSNYSIDENKENFSDDLAEFNDTIEEVEYMMKKGMEYMAAKNAFKSEIAISTDPPVRNQNTLAISPNRTDVSINKSNLKKNTATSEKKVSASLYSPKKCVNRFDLNIKPMPKLDLFKKSKLSATPQKTYAVSPKKTYVSTQSSNLNKSSAAISKRVLVPSNSPKNTASTSAENKSANRFALNIKPIPRFELFKKPIALATPTNTNRQQKNDFSHIVSPVGAYMKLTGTTPLMTTMKTKKTHTDVLNSTAFNQLESESRLYQPNFGSYEKLFGATGKKCSLPKKAYISSNLKHIVDERTPVTIPGCQKINKYIESAMLPSVVRHDGKAKLTNPIIKDDNSSSSQRNDGSLANLSMISGEVSMYTIMDAQKF